MCVERRTLFGEHTGGSKRVLSMYKTFSHRSNLIIQLSHDLIIMMAGGWNKKRLHQRGLLEFLDVGNYTEFPMNTRDKPFFIADILT